MAWLGSLLLFVLLGGGLAALLRYRKSLEDDDRTPASFVPEEVLIARARQLDAALQAKKKEPAADQDGSTDPLAEG